jgi:type I restriction-modification system DNA methylase subunit
MTEALFNRKTLNRQLAAMSVPSADQLSILRAWASTIRDGSIHTQSETEIEDQFKDRIVSALLGYRPFNETGEWTVASKASIGSGVVDLALGNFTPEKKAVVAPFELKGARTRDLDAIMPGRAKSPVQQAWEYASDNVGTKWVLVSNYLEIRLYSYGEGRQFVETFDLAQGDDPELAKRLLLLLSADSLLGGRTAEILAQSRREDRDITNALYLLYRDLRGHLVDAVRADRAELDPLDAISAAQTILDRVLFIAFAEDNGLLPDDSLLRAFEHADPYNPRPVWQNFLGLFRAIDEGNTHLNIPRYNGGLFSRDPVIPDLNLPDAICEGFKRLAEYDFASEVSVTVLGHIFEQSIADVEALQAQALGEEPVETKASGTSGRRKRDGVVYTPDYVARFIVDRTLGAHEREIFAKILARHAKPGAQADDDPIKWKSAKAERSAWEEYRDRLTTLRIVDPACGSGVFLIMAFDWLKAALERANTRIAELSDTGHMGDLYDPDSEILTNNLFGVDVNSESVEIAKLSLWIKTARRGKVLDSLDGNLKVGDSLIEDSSYAYREHGFTWKEAFPQVFAEGGFDVVLGNPPYVRMELLKPMKPWLEKRYEVVSDRADLYAYFFERGVTLLKPGGRLGYISSSTFFKTGSGKPLRHFLRTKAAIETVVDFGDIQIFDGVTTYPVIMTLRAGAPDADHALNFWKLDALPDADFVAAFEDAREPYPQNAMGDGSWELESPALRRLREKIVTGRPTLKDIYGRPLAGIKTGLNEAFVVSNDAQNRLIREDSRNRQLLRRIVFGNEVHPWRVESSGRAVLYIPKNSINIDDFPSIKLHLSIYRPKLEARAARQEWFELQQSQSGFLETFLSRKVIYRDISDRPTFSVDDGQIIDMTCFCIRETSYYESGLFNSNVLWFALRSLTTIASGGFFRMKSQYMETLPIPAATDEQKVKIASLAESAQNTAEKRYRIQQQVARRIPDLAADPTSAKLTNKLKEWWKLPDFAAFQKEVKKALKADIPLKERNDWDSWLSENRAEIDRLTDRIRACEREINAKVYALFDLDADDIALLEANI